MVRLEVVLQVGLSFVRIFTHSTDLTEDAAWQKESIVDRVKRVLRVENDDTEELHNKFRETSKDREEKIKMFEEQLNIKVLKLI